jgi:hypothetical protein
MEAISNKASSDSVRSMIYWRKIMNSSKEKQAVLKPASRPSQLKVRSDLRAGATGDCELGIGYWRKEYNYWKNLAQQLGCA